jgi:uncharacterized protein (TIGR03435 family)
MTSRDLLLPIALVAAIAFASAQTLVEARLPPSLKLRRTAVAQSAEAGQTRRDSAFEVVSVRRNTNANAPVSISTPPGRYIATGVPLRLLINSAYRLAPDQYIGLPNWSESDRFDVSAKAPDGATPEELQRMLQSLLEERFKLVAHMETRDAPIYALVMARDDRRLGPQIARSTMDCGPILAARQAEARGRGPAPVRVPVLGQNERPVCGIRATRRQTPGGATLNGYIAGNTTIARLAEQFRGELRRLVVDRSGLAGEFDFDLQYAPPRELSTAPPGAAPSPDEGPSLFTALQEQLGLKLESTRGPVQYLVIDSVAKPTED